MDSGAILGWNREELGIRDTLLRAKEIASIEDSSPLVVASLHRFLLAVLYRALEGPTDIDQAKALFKEGLPSEKLLRIWESGGIGSGCLMKNIRLGRYQHSHQILGELGRRLLPNTTPTMPKCSSTMWMSRLPHHNRGCGSPLDSRHSDLFR